MILEGTFRPIHPTCSWRLKLFDLTFVIIRLLPLHSFEICLLFYSFLFNLDASSWSIGQPLNILCILCLSYWGSWRWFLGTFFLLFILRVFSIQIISIKQRAVNKLSESNIILQDCRYVHAPEHRWVSQESKNLRNEERKNRNRIKRRTQELKISERCALCTLVLLGD